ncbi:MAG: DUF1266 domain-containing protein [Propionibacteriaceae bacterium]|nr:DUF1266 domain-containing protein [Propionibacteriaceae bacterium]
MTTTLPTRRTPLVTLTTMVDLVTFGSATRSADLRAARARRLHAEASAHAAAELELMRASDAERFAVACAAPFRERLSLELTSAARDGRRAPLLQLMTVPGASGRWRSALAHDFEVSDAATTASFVRIRTTLAHSLAPRSASCATILAAQCLHVATAAAGVGHWSRSDALAAATPLMDLMVGLHGSWESYAASFLAGERTCGRPDDVRHVVFAQVVGRLLNDSRSPWLELAWPDAEAA